MAITSIYRDTSVSPNLVRMETSDTLATMQTAAYLSGQADTIKALNNGEWEWQDDDLILCYYNSASVGLFVRNSSTEAMDLNSGLASGYPVKYAAQYTTTGGAAAEAIAITGVLATDLAFVQLVDDGTNNVSVLTAACSADTLTVTFSLDPVADTIINYQILRAL